MANVAGLVPKVKKWEGGYVNDPADRGGPTNMGITMETFRRHGYDKDMDGDIDIDDLKLVNTQDFEKLLKLNFWDRWRADYIKSQSVAELLVDWLFNSGSWGITIPQEILGVKPDGQVGIVTLAAVNNSNPRLLYEKIYVARLAFIDRITKRSIDSFNKKCLVEKGRPATEKELMKWTHKRFVRGWKNRIMGDFKNFVS